MKTPSQEDLLGYVLGALDAQEQRNVQRLIDENPELEEELLRIKNSLLPLDHLQSAGPRPGLARRTCETVACWQDDQLVDDTPTSIDTSLRAALACEGPEAVSVVKHPVTTRMRPSVSERFLHPNSWSIPDVLVGMALIAIMAGILFPTISYTRYNSRVIACQNNLSQVGLALMNYSSCHDGRFVVIPRDGNLSTVGCFGPILKDSGFLEDDSLLACAGLASDTPVVIPSTDEVMNATCENQINHYRRIMAGHYGYTMGYRENDRYCPPRNMGRTNVVLLADQPSCSQPGRTSLNHGGKGQNCLFEDGRVMFVVGHTFGPDALFENDYGVVGPGASAMDNVIAPSHLSLAQADQLIEVIESSR